MATENCQTIGRMEDVQVSGLVGPALDWAVAKASAIPMFEMGLHGNWPGNYQVTKATQVEPAVIRDLMSKLHFEASMRSVPWSPSADWSQGGPLIDKHILQLKFYAAESPETAWRSETHDSWAEGPTPLIAACRAIVAAHLGEVVSVPAELI